ncbi:MAG: thiol:disulfide interchange protein [Gallionellales bacterium RIFCSPLOWO2_02_FULL_57_47]|nr:MAG: thiol:disulfide interchange protein [Gallionellales bacterium RIFCSPLOWO2_02_FULL_57_47]OGT17529.1 MAG: thiol:disulfide interchange protein [Gallionellales bacterium RIFCSPHIGHO2_02_FULL_57_16]
MMRFILPFIVFMIMAAFMYVGLSLDPHEVPSPLVGKAAPAFTLPQLHEPSKQFSTQDMKGKVWLFNVWASWCTACESEHAVLMELSRQNLVPIYGMDYKDKPEDGEAWLRSRGNPYVLVVSDREGRVGIDYGVYGVPETYVIDKQGVIQYKQIGPVTPENLSEKILPLIKELQAK